ncbi:putative LRR containing protein [Trachipleistophora hominis]|uniref:Putative LRR containing protein n=1 Tax=Trachipleistophora hominis TaxID=72359 RepID=L7JX83_TRAHO|nr:putative LRR containing protein [Trachipleistophora hominis]
MSNVHVEDKLVFNDEIEICILEQMKFEKKAEMWFKPDVVNFFIQNSKVSVDKVVLEDNNETIKPKAFHADFIEPNNENFSICKLYIEKDQLYGNAVVLNLKK